MNDHVYIVLDKASPGGDAIVFNWVWRDRKEAEAHRQQYLSDSGKSPLVVHVVSLRLVPKTA